MDYMNIGHSGIKASVLSLGALGMGGGSRFSGTEDSESIHAIHEALDLGINLIDTAPIYGFGHSEEVVGKAVAGRRDKVILSTKCGFWWDDEEGSYCFTWDDHPVYQNVSRRTIFLEVEKSLTRLGTDYIDIYYTHNPAKPPFMTPIEETVDALMDLKKQGKIRAIGVSNCQPHHIRSYLELGELDIVQRRYNMLDRPVEEEILPLCKEEGLSFHAYSPVLKGLLTGNIRKDAAIPAGDVREGNVWWSEKRLPLAVDFVDGLADICAKYDCAPAHLAIAYLRGQGDFINVICGVRKIKHLQENIRGAEIKLAPEDIAEIGGRLAKLDQTVQELEGNQ